MTATDLLPFPPPQVEDTEDDEDIEEPEDMDESEDIDVKELLGRLSHHSYYEPSLLSSKREKKTGRVRTRAQTDAEKNEQLKFDVELKMDTAES